MRLSHGLLWKDDTAKTELVFCPAGYVLVDVDREVWQLIPANREMRRYVERGHVTVAKADTLDMALRMATVMGLVSLGRSPLEELDEWSYEAA